MDNLKHTPKALALSLLQVLPAPLLLMLVGLALISGNAPMARGGKPWARHDSDRTCLVAYAAGYSCVCPA